MFRFWRRASPARLRHSFGVEAGIGWSMETVSRWTIVKEWRRRSPHGSDWKLPWNGKPRDKDKGRECGRGMRVAI